MSSAVHRIGLLDYVAIFLSLFVSISIGVRIHFTRHKEQTSREFMSGGNNMPKLPVILSVAVTQISAILMLGSPAEIYLFGSQLMMMNVGILIGMMLASYLLLPIYFNLGICSIYEYLEMRYGRFTRMAVSGSFILQMLLYMSVVLHAPALALSAVTDLSTEISILVIGFVCIAYCVLGGLKAVLWTDAFQSGLMFICLFIIVISGILEAGGLTEVVEKCKEGNRWEFFNLNVDLTTRYTLWNTLLRGLSFGIGGFGASQIEIQRLMSINVIKGAQSALLYSIAPLVLITIMCYSMGLILYSIFYKCDPILNGEKTGLTKYDQLVPYYIVTRFSHIPGVTGICIAGLFSGSLSTISSAVNSIATVTVVDFLQPYCSCLNLKDRQILWIAKGLVIFYGVISLGFTYTLSSLRGLTQMANVALSVMEGPVTAIFVLGVLTIKTNQKGSSIGFLAGCLISGWIGYGSSSSSYFYPPLPLSVENCSAAENATQITSRSFVQFRNSTNSTSALQEYPDSQMNTFFLYRISFMWIPTIGLVCTACISYIASIVISCNKKEKIDANFLSPIAKHWVDNSAFEDTEEINLERNTITSGSAGDTAQPIKRKTISDCKL